MPTMGLTNVRNNFGEPGFVQPARCKVPQDSAHAHVEAEIEGALFHVLSLRTTSLASDNEKEPKLARARCPHESDERAMRVALGHPVKVEARLRFQLSASQAFGGITINSDTLLNRRLRRRLLGGSPLRPVVGPRRGGLGIVGLLLAWARRSLERGIIAHRAFEQFALLVTQRSFRHSPGLD